MEVSLKLTIEETNIILKALAHLPYAQSALLINSVITQCKAQTESAGDVLSKTTSRVSTTSEKIITKE